VIERHWEDEEDRKRALFFRERQTNRASLKVVEQLTLRGMVSIIPVFHQNIMRLCATFFTLLLVSLLLGCGEPQADLTTPNTHRSGTIAFEYPKNWRITDEAVKPEVQYIIVETPGDALVVLQSFPAVDAILLEDFASAFSERSAAETPIGKVEESTFTLLPEGSGFRWIQEEFSMSLLGESILHRRLFGARQIGERKVFLIFQVATEDLDRALPGLELIRDSLRGAEVPGASVDP
tara:strand:- start:1415 stop:2122 length:708 start_codon:yes stop_codon:yes gene_type:complete